MFVPQINDNLKHQTLTSQANTPYKQLDLKVVLMSVTWRTVIIRLCITHQDQPRNQK